MSLKAFQRTTASNFYRAREAERDQERMEAIYKGEALLTEIRLRQELEEKERREREERGKSGTGTTTVDIEMRAMGDLGNADGVNNGSGVDNANGACNGKN